jgi:hypothetical protein
MKTSAWLATGLVVAGIAGFASPAHAACSFGPSGEATLQQTFNQLFMDNGALDAVNDCLDDGVGACGCLGSAVGPPGAARLRSATRLLERAVPRARFR